MNDDVLVCSAKLHRRDNYTLNKRSVNFISSFMAISYSFEKSSGFPYKVRLINSGVEVEYWNMIIHVF